MPWSCLYFLLPPIRKLSLNPMQYEVILAFFNTCAWWVQWLFVPRSIFYSFTCNISLSSPLPPSLLVCLVLGMRPRGLHTLDKSSPTEPHAQPLLLSDNMWMSCLLYSRHFFLSLPPDLSRSQKAILPCYYYHWKGKRREALRGDLSRPAQLVNGAAEVKIRALKDHLAWDNTVCM